MREQVCIRFDGSDFPGGPVAALESAGCGPELATITDIPALRQVVVWITLPVADQRVHRLFDSLTRHGIGWLEAHEDSYTEDEIANARLLVMLPNRECEVDSEIDIERTFDLSKGCPECGTGSPQTSPLFIKGEEVPLLEGHRAAETYFQDIFVDERLAADLEDAGVTGLELRSVYALMKDKRQIKLRWKQLCARKTLQRMSPLTSGIIRYEECKLCDRDGYEQTQKAPTRIAYRASDLEGTDDVNMSWEWHGFGVLRPEPWKLARPRLLVTPKVWRIFRNAGVKEIDWLPIRVIDD